MTSSKSVASWRLLATLIALALVAIGCGSTTTTASDTESSETPSSASDEGTAPDAATATLRIGAIPDQEPERLQRTYDLLSTYLETEIDGLTVEYVPVTEYSSAVTGFSVGDLDAVWFGGLTGVQARLEVDGSNAILQRDIDTEFTSV